MARSEIWNRKVIAWAFYDWANSAFALSVMAVLFPLFLGSYWSVGEPGAVVTQRLAWVTSAGSAVVVVLAPVFGTIADAGAYRKRFLFVLAVAGAACTAGLGLTGEGQWVVALLLYLVASVCFNGATVFYDSLLVDVTPPRNFSFVSSLGFSLGYLGGALLLALHVVMLLEPAAFGFADANAVIRFAFVTVGAWWAFFMLPLGFLVPERVRRTSRGKNVLGVAWRELRSTVRNIGRYRPAVMFLLSYCLYIGGVFTVIFMAVNYGQRLGFAQQDLVMALMITNFAGFPATLLYGVFGHRFGAKAGIYVALAVYIAVASWAVFMTDVWQFYVMALIVGCVQGGVQGLSRSLYAELIPPERAGEFFGFYGMVTKLSHVIGPALVGIGAAVSDRPQALLIVLLPLFVAGALLLTRVGRGGAAAG